MKKRARDEPEDPPDCSCNDKQYFVSKSVLTTLYQVSYSGMRDSVIPVYTHLSQCP